MHLDHTHESLMAMTRADLASLVLQFQTEVKRAHAEISLAKATIADQASSIQNKTQALRSALRKRRSLTQAIRRRRKHARKN